MTQYANNAGGTARRSRWKKVLALVLVIGFVLPITVVNLSPKPGIHLFLRPLFDMTTPPSAPIAAAIRQVDARPGNTFAVPGEPDATVTFYTPKASAARPRPVIVWIHGGGWMSGGGPLFLQGYLSLLATKGYVVAAVDYGLAPEHPYPTGIRQAAAALDFVSRRAPALGGDPSRIVIGGDSAGAQLAAQLATMTANARFARAVGSRIATPIGNVRGVILFCGPYDAYTVGRTGFPAMNSILWAYTGKRNYVETTAAKQMSVAHHVPANLPPVYLTVGDGDWLESQSFEYEAALRRNGIDVTNRYWTGSGLGLGHEYQFDVTTRPGQAVLADVTRFLAEKTR